MLRRIPDPGQLLVDDQVKRDDPAVSDCAAGDGDRGVRGTDEHSDRAVDERRSSERREWRAARQDLAGYRRSSDDRRARDWPVPDRCRCGTLRPDRAARRASKSPARRRRGTPRPPRAAWRVRIGGRAPPRTRRLARLASCRAAVGCGRRSGRCRRTRSNMSWSTNASRSAGVSFSSTTSRAKPTESASRACARGPVVDAYDRLRQPGAGVVLAAVARRACRGRLGRRWW